jgi:hypothetical protein
VARNCLNVITAACDMYHAADSEKGKSAPPGCPCCGTSASWSPGRALIDADEQGALSARNDRL